MRDYRQTGRQSCRLSPFHQRLHAEALARASAMLALRKQGLNDYEIGKRFGVTAMAVSCAIRKQGLR